VELKGEREPSKTAELPGKNITISIIQEKKKLSKTIVKGHTQRGAIKKKKRREGRVKANKSLVLDRKGGKGWWFSLLKQKRYCPKEGEENLASERRGGGGGGGKKTGFFL